MMQVSDKLTFVAEVILNHVLEVAWIDLVAKHGSPSGVGADKHFCIIAYGKLGGKEIGYASDLDLVFLYDDPDQEAGERYAKLGRRVASWLSTLTSSGRLYEIDLRLRPDGDAGLLALPIDKLDKLALQDSLHEIGKS